MTRNELPIMKLLLCLTKGFQMLKFFTIFLLISSLSAEPIKVFILAGQSNMQGQGVVSMNHEKYYNGGKGNLLWSMEHSKSKDMMTHLKDKNGKWVVRDDVEISFKDKRGVRKGPLTIGFTGYGKDSHIGPELQFGHIVGDHYKEKVLLIKTAWGGKSLYVDFRPPSSGGKVGVYYKKMIEEIHATLNNLDGKKYNLCGFIWMQGWNDMGDKKSVAEYADNLVNLANDIRAEFKTPELPIVVGELGNGGPKKSGKMYELRKQQKAGTLKIKNAVFVETADCARPAELSPNPSHGHHWFGNAESYFLVGDKLGKGFLKLIKK